MLRFENQGMCANVTLYDLGAETTPLFSSAQKPRPQSTRNRTTECVSGSNQRGRNIAKSGQLVALEDSKQQQMQTGLIWQHLRTRPGVSKVIKGRGHNEAAVQSCFPVTERKTSISQFVPSDFIRTFELSSSSTSRNARFRRIRWL